MGLAKEIVVDQDANGAPRVTIDGREFPWYTAGIVVPTPSVDKMPTVVITIPAEKVTMVNEMLPRAPEPSGGPYRCGHSGCLGRHSLPSEVCC